MTTDELGLTPAINEAVTTIRKGELRQALRDITEVVAEQVCGAMPMYSTGIKLSMASRRLELYAALRVVAEKLNKVADAVLSPKEKE